VYRVCVFGLKRLANLLLQLVEILFNGYGDDTHLLLKKIGAPNHSGIRIEKKQYMDICDATWSVGQTYSRGWVNSRFLNLIISMGYFLAGSPIGLRKNHFFN